MKILNFNAINFTIRKVKRGTSTRSSVVKTPPCNAGGADSFPGLGANTSILDWRIPQTEEPGGLQSMGSKRVGHDQSDLAKAI